MTVSELIAELQKRDPQSVVETWDAYNDMVTDEVYVSDMRDGRTHISDTDYGETDYAQKADSLHAKDAAKLSGAAGSVKK